MLPASSTRARCNIRLLTYSVPWRLGIGHEFLAVPLATSCGTEEAERHKGFRRLVHWKTLANRNTRAEFVVDVQNQVERLGIYKYLRVSPSAMASVAKCPTPALNDRSGRGGDHRAR